MFTAHLGTERFQVGAQVLATGERKVLIESGFDAQYSSTGHLVYGKGSSLFAVPFDADRLEVTGTPVKLFDDIDTFLSGGEALFSLSPSGTLVFVPSPPRTARKLVWMDRSGAATPIATTGARVFANPRLSPDGQRFAVTVAEGEQQNIWVYQLGNERFAPVTFGELNNAPLWTPDGSRLTYTSVRDGIQHLFWQPTDGSGSAESLIASQKNNISAGAWAPDGRSLVYLEDPPTSAAEIKVLTLDGRRSEVVPGIPTRSVFADAVAPMAAGSPSCSGQRGGRTSTCNRFPGPVFAARSWRAAASRSGAVMGGSCFSARREGPLLRPADRPTKGSSRCRSIPCVVRRPARRCSCSVGDLLQTGCTVPMYDVTPDGQRFVMVMAGDEEYTPVKLNVVVNLGDELRRRLPVR